MKQLILFFVFFTIFFSSCVTTEKTLLKTQMGTEKDIDIFVTKLPEKKYTEIAYIESMGSAVLKKKHAYKKLKEEAIKLDADAVINVHFYYTHFWLFFIYPTVDGIAIKYVQ